MLGRLWSHRHLVMTMTRNQYRLRFRQSFVGIFWAVVPPLAMLAVATIVFHKVMGVDTAGAPYALFALAALAPWTFFANSVMFGIPSIMSFPTIISRIAFPRAAIPVSMVGASLVDFAIACLIFVVAAVGLGHGVPASALWVPLLALVELVLVLGIVLLGSALNVFARDVRLAVPVAVQLLLFVTPVMYPLAAVPGGLEGLYRANPMTGLVESFRRVLVTGQAPDLGLLTPALLGAAITFVFGVLYFGAVENRFADVV